MSPASIPTLSEWGLIILSLVMGAFAIGYSRVRR
ncbi:MAG: IPTL-CTERM sorting domain-containing protein [Acidovorax sp.]|nr:IPTL-CTERM sorting domain-containing protein [Acidovorax sp.]